ncbi:MAG: PASTA domain-containing protein [Solirubrobacteraceae bacterium]
MSRAALALGAGCGFLAGVLAVVALGGAGTDTRTVTQARTVTVTSPTITNGGTVIVTTAVPPLVGERLDVAKDRLNRAGFDPDVEGGGVLGIINDSNWQVVTQDPGPGVMLEQGSSVEIRVEKR